MSSFSRHHRASWHSGYTPSLDLRSSSSSISSGSSAGSYGRYSSGTDYASKYSSGSYRRSSASDYSRLSSTSPTSSGYVSRYGSSASSSSTRDYRLGSSSSSSSVGGGGGGAGSTGGGYRPYSTVSDYGKRFESALEYDKHKNSEFRRKSVDTSAAESRRKSVSDHDKPEEELGDVRTRLGDGSDRDCGDGKGRHAEELRTASDRGINSQEMKGRPRSAPVEDEGSSSGLPVWKGKRSVDKKRPSVGSDYIHVAEEENEDQARSRTKAGGLGGQGLKSGYPPDVVSTSARGSGAQEVARLESLCEARTKELQQANMQLKDSLRAFDAVVCLLNYCTGELDAFSCPTISAKLKATTDKLTEQQQNFDRLSQEKSQAEERHQEVVAARDAALQEAERLKEELRQAEETHSAAQQKLQEEQTNALKGLKEEITSQHQDTMQQMQKYQENQSEYTRQSHTRQLVELTSEHQMATNQLRVAHLEEIQELRNKHELQVEELHVQHRKKLEDITDRFESIKLSLTEKVQSLCGECDDLRVRAKTSEDALQRDADVKVQLALTPYMHLPKEIESLKTVIDMRTEEIQKLRRQNMDLVKQLEELPIVQEKVVALQQKVENLQAIINIKTDHEKQLHEKCQVLMRKYDRESRANKRLSMDYEQVVWRMSQSADFTGSTESISPRQLSRSPSRGSQTHSHGSSPVRSLSSSSQGGADTNGVVVVRRQRKTSGGGGGEESSGDSRRRANTLSSDTPRQRRGKGEGDGVGVNGPGRSTSRKGHGLSKSGDYSELVSSAPSRKDHEESFSSGHDSGDTSDFFSSLESNLILETAQGVSFQLLDKTSSADGCAPAVPSQDEVFMEELVLHPIEDVSPEEMSSPSRDTDRQTDVTVVVTSPSSQ